MKKSIKYLYWCMLFMLIIQLVQAQELNLTCQDRPNFELQEKEYCMSEIPSNYSGESFKCISFMTYDGEVIQTNPEYKERSSALVSIIGGDEESRESFIPANLIVNFYYTSKNLFPDYNYTLNLVCHSQNHRLTGNKTIIMDYANLDFVFARTEWAKRNVGYISAGILVLIFMITLLVIIWKQAT